MARFEQYEVWTSRDGKWELLGAFADFDLANTLFRNRTSRVRLVRATYHDGKLVSTDIIAELGDVRS